MPSEAVRCNPSPPRGTSASRTLTRINATPKSFPNCCDGALAVRVNGVAVCGHGRIIAASPTGRPARTGATRSRAASVPHERIKLEKKLAARKHRMKIRFGQDARDLGAFVALNLNLSVLHRAAGAACAPHRLGQLLFFRQPDANKVFHHGHRLAAAPG